MCGIFGVALAPGSEVSVRLLRTLVKNLYELSEARGKEAAGLAMAYREHIDVLKRAGTASEMIASPQYAELFARRLGTDPEARITSPLSFIGHSRLVTNGVESSPNNNQPVHRQGVVGVHNGIIVNDAKLWDEHPDLTREFDVDTEVLMSLIGRYFTRLGSIEAAAAETYRRLEGTASTAVLFTQTKQMLLASNNGSLFYVLDEASKIVMFASEKFTLESALDNCREGGLLDRATIEQVRPGSGLVINYENLAATTKFVMAEVASTPSVPKAKTVFEVVEHTASPASLRKCSRCILPESMPQISFDKDGVCNFCRAHEAEKLKGKEELLRVLDKYRSKDGKPDCIVAFSGGRDSSYGLHYIKTELKMNPVAFTYDWGMVTDLARRNQARMCSQLGVEHIIRAANIPQKRRYIRKNINAWLKRPDLGMIPLFMAGDKQFFHYARQIRKQTGVKLVIFCAGNSLETTNFKTGFCGLKENDHRGIMTGLNFTNKIRLAWYYMKQYLLNPSYINESLIDTLFAFYSMYVAKDDFLYLYRYVPWNEEVINDTLINRYGWETAKDTKSTWRIGDGTAAFYNYIYYTVAGFSEFDTFCSNAIREGIMNREQALTLARVNNKPRLESIKEYSQLVGFNCEEALNIINAIPKRY